jgi:hypothetical protein
MIKKNLEKQNASKLILKISGVSVKIWCCDINMSCILCEMGVHLKQIIPRYQSRVEAFSRLTFSIWYFCNILSNRKCKYKEIF